VWVGFFVDVKVPSPKVHLQVAHTAGMLVDASALKVTVRGATPSLGVTFVKSAVGGEGDGAFVTMTILGAEVAFPPVFIAVKVTV
jgi:hypothetical protein